MHYTLLLRRDKGYPWLLTEFNSPDKEAMRTRHRGYTSMGESPACLKILKTEDGRPETVRAAISALNAPK
jgi:hypothetical protein